MAARLDYRKDGVAAVVSVGETPWHREGTIEIDRKSPNAQRLMTDLDYTLGQAGLDFEVAKAAAFYRDEAGELIEAKTGGIIIRRDRMTELGVVGPVFTPLQNRDAFEPARAVLEQGLATIETAGALDGGADVWLMLRLVPSALMAAAEKAVLESLPEGSSITREMDGLDEYLRECLPFAHFSNHHVGKRAATIQETSVRVVCANTQAMALDGGPEGIRLRVLHHADVSTKYRAAADELFKSLAFRFLSLGDARVALKGFELTQAQFENIVLETAVPVRHLEAKIRERQAETQRKLTMAAIERSQALRDEISTLWTAGKGHKGDRSAWEAYQGLIEFVDHSENVRLVSGSSRLGSLTGGTLGKVKGRVYRELVELATAEA